jgi:hypothetical protein
MMASVVDQKGEALNPARQQPLTKTKASALEVKIIQDPTIVREVMNVFRRIGVSLHRETLNVVATVTAELRVPRE